MNETLTNIASAGLLMPSRLSSSWLKNLNLKLIAEQVGTPVFIYSERQLIRNVERIQQAAHDAGLDERVELYVPFFPNSNPQVLKPFQDLGVGLLLQLPSEYEILTKCGFNKFIISPGHVADDEITYWSKKDHPLFLSSLDEVTHLIETNPNATLNVRLDSLGSGKPGIKYNQLSSLRDLLKSNNRKLDCFELYSGSGNSVDDMIGIVEQVFMIFKVYFPEVSSINFAGGYSFVYEEWDESGKHFEWSKYFKRLHEIANRYDVPRNVKFMFEPARDVLGDVGALLLDVRRKPIRNPGAYQILTNGSRVLMPSAQYKERHHNVIFLDSSMAEMNPNENSIEVALRGRGILRHDYVLPGEYTAPGNIGPGDHLIILDVGSYCATQHMEFLNIPPAAEVVIDTSGTPHLVTEHGKDLDKWRYLMMERKRLE